MELYILGKSEGYLSFLLETVAQLKFSKVSIVNNLSSEAVYPYLNKQIGAEEINTSVFQQRTQPAYLSIGVGKPKTRKKVADYFEPMILKEDKWTNIISPKATVASTATFGKGIYAEPGVVVSSYANIDDFVFLNRQVSIGHHSSIGSFCSIMPGSHIAGFCSIGAGTMIGIGTVVFDGVSIGSNCIIGGGSVVTKDIADGTIAWGNPCKPVKQVSSIDYVI
jgi:sugar O-acyltransferase (sialic acid O-acetyltransferase NeuD family)